MKLPILTIALAAACSGQLFPIAGVVVDSQSGSTLNRAHVILNAGQSRERSVITHDDGRFSFEVGEGKYTLTADYRSGRQVFGLAGPSTGYGSAIVTGPGRIQVISSFGGSLPAQF